ncbi:M16 family metallopeptidase [Coleofasciculus sp. LEGE 07092]|uniref:M16 family metallopeptidase n=2 Tax=unclassified Coleofasciculus TaxID=2692782 RepID=UPI0018815416|nr:MULTISPECIES: pitrilysin family protein [unclassified Coleofasciculus]MBE9127394.1 insulinase family protein [Coleofasciculus sp. LEGE 07081]MBE9147180.1 insulinase family protein [Coleofasciculus sp. LEGE 07092]
MSQLSLFIRLWKRFAIWRQSQWDRLLPTPASVPLVAVLVAAMLMWGSTAPVALARTETPSAATESIQPYLDRVIDRVTEFRLDNGIKFIVLENHQAPVVSFVTYADVGGANEPTGKTGVAHFLEHLAFKGTQRIGTVNYEAEKPLLDQLDQLAEQIRVAKATGKEAEVAKLQEEFSQVEAEAANLAKQNELGQIVERAGGVGLNAATSADATVYFYSFPSNKLELWMSLESERFLEPVFREFYKEQEVILEERRLRTDNSPIGQMIEAFLDTAFQVHPYKRPVIGYNEDIRNLTREDVQQFFETHYGPNNLTFAVVGDVDPAEVKQLAQTYFGRFKTKPAPPEVTAIEPPQQQAREVTLRLPSQPWYLEGYHRPSIDHPDNAVYEIIGRLLSDGRTSRLYKSLVEEKQVALSAQGFSGFPGDKYPNLMLFYALTAPRNTVEDVATALRSEIEQIKTEPVSPQELERVKTQARAELLRTLDSNMGMARNLVEYEVKTGDWRNLFEQLKAIAAVTPADIQRVAASTFQPENRTIGRLLSSQ